MSVTHSFSVEIAKQIGVDGAILINHFGYWHDRNKTANNNFVDGRFWTYNTVKALADQFPYWTEKQVRTHLSHLLAADYLLTAHYGGSNRTTWYALTEKGLNLLGINCTDKKDSNHLPKRAIPFAQTGNSNLPNGQMDLPKRANVYKDTDTTTDTTTDKVKQTKAVITAALTTVRHEYYGVLKMPLADYQTWLKTIHIARSEKQVLATFEQWYNLYGKKRTKPEALAQWKRMSKANRAKAIEHTSRYVVETEWRYRKDPKRYLSHQTWMDEIDEPTPPKPEPSTNPTNYESLLRPDFVAQRANLTPHFQF